MSNPTTPAAQAPPAKEWDKNRRAATTPGDLEPERVPSSVKPRVKGVPEPGTPRTSGRVPTVYRPELALAICERLAGGETLKAICQDDGMPSPITVRNWALARGDFREAFAAARDGAGHSIFDESLDMARDLKNSDGWSSSKVRAYDVTMAHLRWTAGKLAPQEYSEKAAVNIVVPIQINTPLDLADSGAPGPEPASSYQIEAVVVAEPKRGPGRPKKQKQGETP